MNAPSRWVSIAWICGAAHAASPVSGPETLALLKQGNESAAQDPASLKEAPPHAIVISCTDFYVPVETLLGQKPGSLLNLRVPGEVFDTKTVHAVETALERFGTRLILVLGHESCHAVQTALQTPEGLSAEEDRVVASIRPGVERFKASDKDPGFRKAVKATVFASAMSLVRKSARVREAIQKDGLIIAQGLYSPVTGKVEFSEDMGKVLVRLHHESQTETRKPASVKPPAEKPASEWKAKVHY